MDRPRLIRFAAVTAMLLELTAGAGAGAGPAFAQTSASATMAVSIEVTPNCTVAAQPLAFGTVAAADAPASTATAAIDVACGPNVPFTIQLDNGQNASDGTRRALDPATGQTVGYDIFADAAHTLRWGSLAAETVAGVIPNCAVDDSWQGFPRGEKSESMTPGVGGRGHEFGDRLAGGF